MASDRKTQLMELASEGDESAKADLWSEYPSLYLKLFPEDKPKKRKHGSPPTGEVVKRSKSTNKRRGVGKAIKGFGRA
mgnify:FL=1